MNESMTSDTTSLYQNACHLYQKSQLKDARKICFALLKINPDHADYLHLLAVIQHRLGNQTEAIKLIKKALTITPDSAEFHFGLSLMLLLNGHFNAGWEAFEWRLKISNFNYTSPSIPQWQGNSLTQQNIVVICDQGYGDCIQFIRYVPLLHLLGATVSLVCPVPLTRLFIKIPGVTMLTNKITDFKPFDCYIFLASLPGLFKTTHQHVPKFADFIHADKQLTAQWRPKIPQNKLKIGIAWSGRPTHENNHNRSCDLSYFIHLAEHNTHASFISLQLETIVDIPTTTLIQFGSQITDFSDTAAIIQQLDLVITVDTAVAHLAATLAKPTWILLPYVPDWRWLNHGKNSYWYPAVQLFRQSQPGDWKSVFQQVESAFYKLFLPKSDLFSPP